MGNDTNNTNNTDNIKFHRAIYRIENIEFFEEREFPNENYWLEFLTTVK